MDDNLPKLYVHHAAFMKVLGGTIDVEFDSKTGDLTRSYLIERELWWIPMLDLEMRYSNTF